MLLLYLNMNCLPDDLRPFLNKAEVITYRETVYTKQDKTE